MNINFLNICIFIYNPILCLLKTLSSYKIFSIINNLILINIYYAFDEVYSLLYESLLNIYVSTFLVWFGFLSIILESHC